MESEVRLIDYDAAIDRYYAEYEKQDIYDGADDRDWLKKCFDEAPTIDPESLRPKGRWEIHCRSTYDSWTQETDEEFYLECSECKRQVWDVDYMAVQNDDRQKLIEKYPYCHCGCKMEG